MSANFIHRLQWPNMCQGMLKVPRNCPLLVCLLSLCSLFSCASIKRSALNSIGELFIGSEDNQGNSFTRDSDPELIAASLPTVLKMTELLRDAAPKDPGLNFGAGQIAVMYAGGFLQPQMEQSESFAQRKRIQARAKAMYLRGRDSIISGLGYKYQKQDFTRKFGEDNIDELLSMLQKEDMPYLYWGALGWLGAFALDPFDFELLVGISRPVLLLWRAMQLAPEYAQGSLHTSMISVMGSLPDSQLVEAMRHSPKLLRPFFEEYYQSQGIDWKDRRSLVLHHFREGLRLSEGQDPSLYVAMANWTKANQDNPEQDRKRFREYLERALAIDAEENISNRLLILLYQQQAEWLLAKTEEYFL